MAYVLWAVLFLSVVPAFPAEPIRLAAGPHLFIDDYLIETQSNLRRIIVQPQRLPEPVVTALEDTNWQPWFSVLRDSNTGRFPHLVQRLGRQADEAGLPRIGRWRALGASAPLSGHSGTHYIRRHHLRRREGIRRSHPALQGVLVVEVPVVPETTDGIRWNLLAEVQMPKTLDHTHFLWDPFRRRYLAILGAPSTREDGYKGGTRNAAEGYRRLVGRSLRSNLRDWSPCAGLWSPTPRTRA